MWRSTNFWQFCTRLIVVHLRWQYSTAGQEMIKHWLSSDSGCLKKQFLKQHFFIFWLFFCTFSNWPPFLAQTFNVHYTIKKVVEVKQNESIFSTLPILQLDKTMTNTLFSGAILSIFHQKEWFSTQEITFLISIYKIRGPDGWKPIVFLATCFQ